MAAEKLVLPPDEIGPAITEILKLGQAHFISQCLYSVVKLGVPDIIGAGSLTVPQIAAKLPGTPNQDALRRCMRLLTLNGFFKEHGEGSDAVFSLAPVGALLQTGAPQPSMACGVLHWMERDAWASWGELPDYIAGKTAAVPWVAHNGQGWVEFYRDHPESAAPFNEFMSFFSAGELPLLLQHGKWEELSGRTVLDVGGSYGAVMGAVKEKFPEVNCLSFDLAEVIDKAPATPPGVEFIKGDMFDPSTIPQSDIIVLKHVLHDWSDEDCVRILKSCHTALPPTGEVYVVDAVLPDPGELSPEAAPALNLDMLMLLIGGKERMRSQWRSLADEASFEIKELRLTGHPTCNFVILKKC